MLSLWQLRTLYCCNSSRREGGGWCTFLTYTSSMKKWQIWISCYVSWVRVTHFPCYIQGGKFSFYTGKGYQDKILSFSDAFWCDLNESDNNYFCRKSLVVTDRWESGVLDGKNQCWNRPTQNPGVPLVAPNLIIRYYLKLICQVFTTNDTCS